jgi:hypothetical protein
MPLNYVALTVADRERSAAFYGEHFGLLLDPDGNSVEAVHREREERREACRSRTRIHRWSTRPSATATAVVIKGASRYL